MDEESLHSDPQERIRGLEAEVARLKLQVGTLRADRDAHVQRGRRSTDPAPQVVPLRGRMVSGWLFLIVMTAFVALAVWLNVDWSKLHTANTLDEWRHLAQTEIGFPLVGVVVCALLAVVFCVIHRWLLFMTFALAAVYASFALFFLNKPAPIIISDDAYTALSLGGLTAAYLAFCDLCVRESRRFARGRRRPAFLASINSLLYYALVWTQLQSVATEWSWLPYLALSGIAVLFAWHAETVGAHKNYMVRLFVVKAVLLLNMALWSGLNGDGLLIALGFECLALAIAYRLTGIVVVKVLSLFLLVAATALCIGEAKDTHAVAIGEYLVQSNWLTSLIVAAFLLVVAWYYERVVHGMRPQHRRISTHWFLADTQWDVPRAVASVLHATAAALIVLMLLITELGDRPELPYVLAGASVALAVLGLVWRTPQMEVGAVMLIVSAHVAFYFFLAMKKTGFGDQPYFIPATLGVVLYTFFGAYRWERFLERFRAASSGEYHGSAVAPYAVGTLMLVTLMGTSMPAPYAAAAQNALGLVLMALGAFFRRSSWKGTAFIPLAAGTIGVTRMLNAHPSLLNLEVGGAVLSTLLAYVLAERFLCLREGEDLPFATISRRARTILVIACGAVGFAAVFAAIEIHLHLALWLALAVANAIFGAFILESRYRWTGLVLFLAALVTYFVETSKPTLLSVAAACVACAILVLSWGVARRRQRGNHRKGPGARLSGSSQHG